MKTVKKLKKKIEYHNDEIQELRYLIYTAQKMCIHNYIDDITSISKYSKQICTICDKVKIE